MATGKGFFHNSVMSEHWHRCFQCKCKFQLELRRKKITTFFLKSWFITGSLTSPKQRNKKNLNIFQNPPNSGHYCRCSHLFYIKPHLSYLYEPKWCFHTKHHAQQLCKTAHRNEREWSVGQVHFAKTSSLPKQLLPYYNEELSKWAQMSIRHVKVELKNKLM